MFKLRFAAALCIAALSPVATADTAFSAENVIATTNMAYDMGWECYESSRRGMTVECASFLSYLGNEYAEASESMVLEGQRVGALLMHEFTEYEMEELTRMMQEIGQLYVYAESMRARAVEEARN